jgi:adenylate kinase
VKTTGIGKFLEQRTTDVDPALARLRYQQFKEQIYESIKKIKDKFLFHFVDADGTIEEVQHNSNDCSS